MANADSFISTSVPDFDLVAEDVQSGIEVDWSDLELQLSSSSLTLNDVSTFDMYGGRFAAFMEFDFPKFNIIEPHIEK